MLQRSALPTLLSVVLVALLVVTTSGARADEVDDALAAAKDQGKDDPMAALKSLDGLAEKHPDDARIEYHRARLMEQLGRMDGAAETIERAEMLYDLNEEDHPEIHSVRNELSRLANDLLRYRRKVQKEVADYRTDGLTTARKLLAKGEPGCREAALWVLQETEFLVGKDDGEIAAMRRKCEPESAKAVPQPDENTARAGNVSMTLKDCEKEAKKRNWDTVEELAIAVIATDPHNRAAFAMLAESLVERDRVGAGVATALVALDAPSVDRREARGINRDIEKILRKYVSDVIRFLRSRENAVKAILRAHKGAERADRPHDLEWMINKLLLLAPTHEDVAEVARGTSDQRLEARRKFLGIDDDGGTDPSARPAPGGNRGDYDAEISAELDAGDKAVAEGEEIVSSTRDDNFKGSLKDSLESAIEKYREALVHYRKARDLKPGDKYIEEQVRLTNQKIFWAKKSMPID